MHKKGQEEIVGFVVVVVLIALAFLIFLALTVRQGNTINPIESKDVAQFLSSIMETTTDCAPSYVPNYATLSRLHRNCLNGIGCIDGRDSCQALNQTLTTLLTESWSIGPDKPLQMYTYSSTYLTNNTEKTIITIKTGMCNGIIRGTTYITPVFPGRIETKLLICG